MFAFLDIVIFVLLAIDLVLIILKNDKNEVEIFRWDIHISGLIVLLQAVLIINGLITGGAWFLNTLLIILNSVKFGNAIYTMNEYGESIKLDLFKNKKTKGQSGSNSKDIVV
ncbi:MAG: hypothetical protein IJ272_03725 [Clostridia bacterium]|nr:hypothetical protein [Clostridia bacterium]